MKSLLCRISVCVKVLAESQAEGNKHHSSWAHERQDGQHKVLGTRKAYSKCHQNAIIAQFLHEKHSRPLAGALERASNGSFKRQLVETLPPASQSPGRLCDGSVHPRCKRLGAKYMPGDFKSAFKMKH